MQKTLVTAKWCGPCTVLKNTLEREGLKVAILDIDTDPTYVKKHNIRSVPVLVIEEGISVQYITGSREIIDNIKES